LSQPFIRIPPSVFRQNRRWRNSKVQNKTARLQIPILQLGIQKLHESLHEYFKNAYDAENNAEKTELLLETNHNKFMSGAGKPNTSN